jgi:hypothetical protein
MRNSLVQGSIRLLAGIYSQQTVSTISSPTGHRGEHAREDKPIGRNIQCRSRRVCRPGRGAATALVAFCVRKASPFKGHVSADLPAQSHHHIDVHDFIAFRWDW